MTDLTIGLNTPARADMHIHARREPALDELRALAIVSVVIYHLVAMSPVPLPQIARFTQYGQFGVDLFFVLSGWLIGGLFWRERAKFGDVELKRFWARRWLRTLPPYFVALVASWFAVSYARSQPFDWRYLVFLQNYYQQIPFFLVSWSLCIEEHFYVLAPFLAGIAVSALSAKSLRWVWVAAIALSPLLRLGEWRPDAAMEDFGYFNTATHLRLDALALGFGLSYMSVFAKASLGKLARWAPLAAAISLVALVALESTGGIVKYVLWPSFIAALCASLLLWALNGPQRGSAGILKVIALASYSAYLVHPLCIHAVRAALAQHGAFWILYWPGVIALIIAATAAFYIGVERGALLARDILAPSRRR